MLSERHSKNSTTSRVLDLDSLYVWTPAVRDVVHIGASHNPPRKHILVSLSERILEKRVCVEAPSAKLITTSPRIYMYIVVFTM